MSREATIAEYNAGNRTQDVSLCLRCLQHFNCGKSGTMIGEMENQEEEQERKSFSMKGVAKWLAILYVLAIYILIFLKVLFLK